MVTKNSGLSSALVNILGFIVPFFVFVFVTPVLVDHLGSDQYGLLLALGSMVVLLGSLDLGLITGSVHTISRLLERMKVAEAVCLLQGVLTVFLILATLAFVTIIFFSDSLISFFSVQHFISSSQVQEVIYLIASLAFITLLSLPLLVLFQAKQVFHLMVMIQVFTFMLTWLGAAFFVWSEMGALVEILYWQLVVQVVRIFLLLKVNITLLPEMRWLPSMELKGIQQMFSFSGYAFINQLSALAVFHLDRFFLVALAGPASVSYYAVSVTITNKFLALANAIVQFVFPRISSLSVDEHKQEIIHLYLLSRRYVFLLLLPCFVPLYMYAGDILDVWLGKGFAKEATQTMQLLTIAYMFALTSVAPSQVFNGMGNTKIGAYFAMLGLLVNVLICYLFIPEYGAVGAALAALVSMSQALLYMYYLERTLDIARLSSDDYFLLKVVGACVVQLFFILLVHEAYWVLALFFSWLLFYIYWVGLGFMNNQDKALLKRLFNRVARASH